MIREGDMATLTRQKGLFLIGLAPGQKLPEEQVRALGCTVDRDGDLWEVTVPDGQSIDPVVQLLSATGRSLRHLVEKRQSLEDLFIKTVESSEPGVDRRRRRQTTSRDDAIVDAIPVE